MDSLARALHHLSQATSALSEHARMNGPHRGGPPPGRGPNAAPALARRLAAHGRNGDTMLAHINPREAKKLKKDGGAGTINPHTGLPEFYDMGPGGSNEGGGAAGGFGGGGVNDIGGGVGNAADTAGLGGVGPGLGFSPDQMNMAAASSPTGVAGSTSAGLNAATGGMAGLGSGIGPGVTSGMLPYQRTALDKVIGALLPGFTGLGSPTAVPSGIVGLGRAVVGNLNPGMAALNALDTITGGYLSAHGDKTQGGYGSLSGELAGQSIDPALLAAINGSSTG